MSSSPLKVKLFSKYSRQGASSRLRSLQYLPALNNANIKVDVSPLFDDQYLELLYTNSQRSLWQIALAYAKRFFSLFSIFKYDVVWIEYELFPFFPAWAEKILVLCGVNYIVDYDDAIFHSYDLSKHSLIRLLMANKIDKVMRLATVVMVGNDYLKERALAAGAKRVEWIPTVIDIQRYPISKPDSDLEKKELIIGWIGSPSTQHYLVELKSVLEKICVKEKCKLLLIGAHPAIVKELNSVNVEVVPWQEASEVEFIQSFDIGIMPLSDGPWEKGKCGYKLIQYMACAKPVVASAVGVNVFIVENTQCGLLAHNAESWLKQLQILIDDAALRKLSGSKGRAAVETIYSLEQQASKLIQILRGATKSCVA